MFGHENGAINPSTSKHLTTYLLSVGSVVVVADLTYHYVLALGD